VTDIVDPIRSTDAGVRASLAALGAIGLAMVSLTAIGLRIQDPYWNTFVLLLVLHGFLAIAATKVAERAPGAFGLALVAVVAIGMRLMVLGEDPILSSDIYRYIWDGRVQGAGINPYRYIPADPHLARLGRTLTEKREWTSAVDRLAIHLDSRYGLCLKGVQQWRSLCIRRILCQLL